MKCFAQVLPASQSYHMGTWGLNPCVSSVANVFLMLTLIMAGHYKANFQLYWVSDMSRKKNVFIMILTLSGSFDYLAWWFSFCLLIYKFPKCPTFCSSLLCSFHCCSFLICRQIEDKAFSIAIKKITTIWGRSRSLCSLSAIHDCWILAIVVTIWLCVANQ